MKAFHFENRTEVWFGKHNIPYHNTTDNTGEMFDRSRAEQFDAPNRLIVFPGEELLLK